MVLSVYIILTVHRILPWGYNKTSLHGPQLIFKLFHSQDSLELTSSIIEDFTFVEIVENIKILASNGLFNVAVKEKEVLKFANKNNDEFKIGNIDKVDIKGSVIGLRYKGIINSDSRRSPHCSVDSRQLISS